MAETVAPVFITSNFWKWEVKKDHCSSDRTHVEDTKDPSDFRPQFFLFPFVPRLEDRPGNLVLYPVLKEDIPLDFHYNTVVR
jgi:hypothetical protein